MCTGRKVLPRKALPRKALPRKLFIDRHTVPDQLVRNVITIALDGDTTRARKNTLQVRGHRHHQLIPAVCSSSSVKDPLQLPLSRLQDLDIILMVGRLCLCTSRGLSAERSTLVTLFLFRVEMSLPRRTSEGVG